MNLEKGNFRKLLYAFTVCFCFVLQTNSQTDKQLAYRYIKKANLAIEKSIDYTEALINFNKAMQYMGVITDKNIASLGARAYYEIHHKQRTLAKQIQFLEKSNKYSKQYFLLAKNKQSNDYLENMELYSLAKRDLKKLRYAERRKRMGKF